MATKPRAHRNEPRQSTSPLSSARFPQRLDDSTEPSTATTGYRPATPSATSGGPAHQESSPITGSEVADDLGKPVRSLSEIRARPLAMRASTYDGRRLAFATPGMSEYVLTEAGHAAESPIRDPQPRLPAGAASPCVDRVAAAPDGGTSR